MSDEIRMLYGIILPWTSISCRRNGSRGRVNAEPHQTTTRRTRSLNCFVLPYWKDWSWPTEDCLVVLVFHWLSSNFSLAAGFVSCLRCVFNSPYGLPNPAPINCASWIHSHVLRKNIPCIYTVKPRDLALLSITKRWLIQDMKKFVEPYFNGQSWVKRTASQSYDKCSLSRLNRKQIMDEGFSIKLRRKLLPVPFSVDGVCCWGAGYRTTQDCGERSWKLRYLQPLTWSCAEEELVFCHNSFLLTLRHWRSIQYLAGGFSREFFGQSPWKTWQWVMVITMLLV